jgi:hypothetical protein
LKFGEELIITDPKINKWIGKAGQKNDPIDAEKLAQLAREKYVKEIYHPVNHRRRFKDLVFAYHDTVKTCDMFDLALIVSYLSFMFIKNHAEDHGRKPVAESVRRQLSYINYVEVMICFYHGSKTQCPWGISP